MKTIFFIIMLMSMNIYAQFGEGQTLIDINGPVSSVVNDINGDSVKDFIFATHATGADDFNIYWCNINDDQTCGELNTVDSFYHSMVYIDLKVVDLDRW